MSDSYEIDGQRYLTLETVAEVFAVEVVLLREAFLMGVLGPGVEQNQRVLLAVASLDRVATVVRMRVMLGLDLETIEIALDR